MQIHTVYRCQNQVHPMLLVGHKNCQNYASSFSFGGRSSSKIGIMQAGFSRSSTGKKDGQLTTT